MSCVTLGLVLVGPCKQQLQVQYVHDGIQTGMGRTMIVLGGHNLCYCWFGLAKTSIMHCFVHVSDGVSV